MTGMGRAALVGALDELFRIGTLPPDESMAGFVPQVYEPTGIDVAEHFEPSFLRHYNGLMVRGGDRVGRAFGGVFPDPATLERFLAEGERGDVLVLHHPIDMETGDPRGDWGRGFLPISGDDLERLRSAGLSVYASHLPMDIHPTVGTTAAMIEVLGATARPGGFFPWHDGFCGRICDLPARSSDDLAADLLAAFGLPYLDREGADHDEIGTIAVIAGCGDVVDAMREAEAAGAQAYVTGEIHCRIDNDYGRWRWDQMQEYVAGTSMTILGVSHAASEFLVVPTQLRSWLAGVGVELEPLPMARWWR